MKFACYLTTLQQNCVIRNAHYVPTFITYMTEFSIVCKLFQVRNQQVIRLTITFPHSIHQIVKPQLGEN